MIPEQAFAQPATSRGTSRTAASTVEIAKQTSPSIVTITSPGSLGSGVIVDSSGVIVTNLHVLRGERRASIKLANGDIYDDVAVVDVDARKDLLILKIKATGLPAVAVGNSDNVRIGEPIVAIGSPRGLDHTISNGIISAIRDSGEGYRLFQTNAAASTGSSGGGMFNQDGELIGIVTSKITSGENLNFGVPINYARGLFSTRAMMTLETLALAHPRPADNAAEVTEASEGASAENATRLASLVKETGLKYESTGEGSWRFDLKGENAETVPVHVWLHEDLAIVQCIVAKKFSLTDLAAGTDFLQRNFVADLAKLALTNEGILAALGESEVRLLDARGLKRIVYSVGSLADDVFGTMGHSPSEEMGPALHGPPDVRNLETLFLRRRHLALTYHGSAWDADSIRDENEVYELKHSSGVAFIRVIAEKAEIPMGTMFDLMLANAKRVSSDITEVRRGWRLVNGVKVGFIEFDAIVEKLKIRYYGHFYSDGEGTLQILGYCRREMMDGYRDQFDNVVSGLQVKK